MAQRFEHCRVEGTRVTYLGRAGLFEDKRDQALSEFAVWDRLENQGWELVTVVVDRDGQHVAYLKRPVQG